jgi:hypothetical protein
MAAVEVVREKPDNDEMPAAMAMPASVAPPEKHRH